ncbi:hypothetical protein QE152_g25702 [Popillia japonica]|uniref:Uncharacterized protein n=1 Tax=Popillia japonica TaxID=7064 RepID=A0AAW1K1V5_POPJA
MAAVDFHYRLVEIMVYEPVTICHCSTRTKTNNKIQKKNAITFFSLQVLPIVVIVAFTFSNYLWYFPYWIATRPEKPLYIPPRQKYPFDEVDILRHPWQPKLLQYNQIYKPLPDLAEIYERIQKEEKKNEEHDEEVEDETSPEE